MGLIRVVVLVLALGVLPHGVPLAVAADPSDPNESALSVTPPRLSLVEGRVSFWRMGAEDWAEAQVNTPLAPGDELATAAPGGIELQVGARAFVRGAAETQIGLQDHDADFLQIKVTAGGVALDLRQLESGQSVEVDTPSAAFIIEHPGYYRVDVVGERTSFITRRGGRATATPATGEAIVIGPSTQLIVDGVEEPDIRTYPSPKSDDWDRWNYARTKELLQPGSAQYVAAGTYGVSDLDRYGTWRTVPTYGAVWAPREVPSGWAPYTTGAWTLDPVYGWTWVDSAPWGWAPYHHGRWVHVHGAWAWAPGPLVRRAVYAPALVAFLGGVTVTVGSQPAVTWVALGWGEPLVPWWGRPGFAHVPSWHGWGGPRMVNNVVITKSTVVTVQHIHVYHNTRVQNAVVAVHQDHFGRGRISPAARVHHVDRSALRPVHTGPHVAPTAASLMPSTSRGIRPPEDRLQRRVVATRPPRHSPPGHGAEHVRPTPRVVSVPERAERAKILTRIRPGAVERTPTAGGSHPTPSGRERVEHPRANAPGAVPGPPQAPRSPSGEPAKSVQGAGPGTGERGGTRGQPPAPPSRERPGHGKSEIERPPAVVHQGKAPEPPAPGKGEPSARAAAPPPGERVPPPVPVRAGQSKSDSRGTAAGPPDGRGSQAGAGQVRPQPGRPGETQATSTSTQPAPPSRERSGHGKPEEQARPPLARQGPPQSSAPTSPAAPPARTTVGRPAALAPASPSATPPRPERPAEAKAAAPPSAPREAAPASSRQREDPARGQKVRRSEPAQAERSTPAVERAASAPPKRVDSAPKQVEPKQVERKPQDMKRGSASGQDDRDQEKGPRGRKER